jgi:outer membrane cobalamin receptor
MKIVFTGLCNSLMQGLQCAGLACALCAFGGAASAADAPPRETPFDLGEIQVTADREPETANFFPGIVDVITEEQIKNSHAKNVMELLGALPGVWSSRNWALFGTPYGQGADGVNIRGQNSFDSVGIIVNGRQDNMMNLMGHPLVDGLQVDNIERIEIYKGPASVLFGANARGGVINVITKKASQDTEATVYNSAGSFNTFEHMVKFGDSAGPYNIYATYSKRQTDGYLPEDAALAGFNDGRFNSNNVSLHVSRRLSPTKIVSVDARHNRFVGSMVDSGDGPYDRNRWGLDLMLETAHPSFKNNLHIYHGQGRHRSFGNDNFDSMDMADGVTWTHQMQTNKKNLLMMGAEFQRYGGKASNNANGVDFFATKAGGSGMNLRNMYSAYFADTFRNSDTWTFNAGMRAVHNFLSGWEAAPQLGATYHATANTRWGLTYGKAYYLPSLRESLLMPVNFNPDLKPEFTEQYELSYTAFHTGRWQWQTAVFHIRNWNRIERSNWRLGAPGWPPQSYENYPGEEIIKGAETSWTRYWGAQSSLNISYTHLDVDNSEMDRTQAGAFTQPDPDHKNFTPEQQIDVNLSGLIGSVSATANVQYVNDLYSGGEGGLPGANSAAVRDTYTLLNLHFNHPVWDDSRAFLSVDNALDADYALTDFSARTGTGAWTMPGRTWTLGFEWNL